MAWRHTFHILSLLLNLTSLGLTLLVFALSTVGILTSEITVVFKLLKLIQFIFHPGIVQNLFFEIPKTLFSAANAIIFLDLLPLDLSGILQKMSTLTLLLPLSLL